MKKRKLLQIVEYCKFPFVDVAKHYAAVFDESRYDVVTLFLAGAEQGRDDNAQRTILWDLDNQSSHFQGMQFVYRIVSLIQKEHFDVVVCHDTKTLYSLSLARRFLGQFDLVCVLQNVDASSKKLQHLYSMMKKDKVLLLATSDDIRHRLLEQFERIPDDRVVTCYPGLDFKRIKANQLTKVEARRQLQLNQDDFLFVNVDRLEPESNYRSLIEGFSLISDNCPDAKLVFMGSGSSKQAIVQQARELLLGDRIFLHDTHDHPGVYLKAFDGIIWSSDKKSFNLSLLESMASGVPVITANGSGGSAEIIQDATAVFKENDVYQLAYQLRRVYESTPEDRLKAKERMYSHLKHRFSVRACRKIFWSSDAGKKLDGALVPSIKENSALDRFRHS